MGLEMPDFGGEAYEGESLRNGGNSAGIMSKNPPSKTIKPFSPGELTFVTWRSVTVSSCHLEVCNPPLVSLRTIVYFCLLLFSLFIFLATQGSMVGVGVCVAISTYILVL